MTKVKKKSFAPDYGTINDWRMRIKDSVVFYDGIPFYVEEIVTNLPPEVKRTEVELISLYNTAGTVEQQRERRKNLDDFRASPEYVAKYSASGFSLECPKDFVDEPPRSDRKTIPVEELDLRIRNIGLSNFSWSSRKGKEVKRYIAYACSRAPFTQTKQGLQTRNIQIKPVSNDDRGLFERSSILSGGYISSLYGIYPSPDECLKRLFECSEENSMAFSNQFSFTVDEVGHVTVSHLTRHIGTYSQEREEVSLLGKYHYLKESLEELGVSCADNL